MDVRLPDGTLITNVPDGTTKAQLDAKLALIGYDTAALTSAAQDNNSAFSEPEPDPAPIESLTQPAPIESLTQPAPIESLTQPAPIESLAQPAPKDMLAQPAPKDMLAQPAPKDMLAEPEEPRNIVFEVFAQVAAGAVVAIPEMIGKAADWINPGSGTDLREWAEEVEDNNPWLAQQTEGRTAVGKAFSDGARMLAPSITSVATAGVAVVLAPLLGAGAALTAAIGTGVTALTIVGLFGASQAEDTYEKLLADGVPENDARKAAWMTGIIEAGGEGIANRFTFGLLKGVTGPLLKETAEIILQKSTSTAIIAPFAKNTLLNAAGEVATEFGQGASQTAIENIYGAKDQQSPWSVGAEGGASALAMSVLLAPFGLRANFKRSELNAALEDENAPENLRYRAAVRVHAALTDFDVEQDTALKATLKDISSDNSISDGQKNVALQEARSNARKDAGDNWASNVWARNAGLAIQQKLAVDLSPEQLTTPAEPNAPEPALPLIKAAYLSESRANLAAIEAKLAAKTEVLTGGKGVNAIVEDITDETKSLDNSIDNANLVAGTVSNPATVQDRIAQGYAEVPNGSEYLTRLTKTNDDKTVNTIEVGPNGAVESDTTLVGNFTVNDAPVSVRFDNINSRLQAIEEDGNVTDLSDDANRKYTSGALLLDVIQAEDPGATIVPVALGETVAPAETPASADVYYPDPRDNIFTTERAVETPATEAVATEAGAELSPEDRRAKVTQIKTLLAEVGPLAKESEAKGGLTAVDGERYSNLVRQISALNFDVARPLNLDKLPDAETRQSTLDTDTVVKARADLLRDRPIYTAIMDAAAGTAFNAETAVDDIVGGRNEDVSAQKFYDNFAQTREAIRATNGDTIKLFRAEGLQKGKPTQNWATTEAYARQFGPNVVSRDIPVDNILAVNVGPNGRYHEVIVGQPPATQAVLPQKILDLAEKNFTAEQNLIDNKANTPEGRVPAKYSTAATMAFRRLNTALKEIEPNEEKRLAILRDLSSKNMARVAALRAAPATDAAAPAAQTAAPQPINLEAQIENLKEKASRVDSKSVAGRILSRTVEHLTAPTKASRVNLKSVLTNPEAKAGTDAQVVEAVDAAEAALASEGEATFTASKPDINKKRMTKLLGPQLYGNMSDIGIVTVKELFQNSFDAVKGALERGSISLGHITITTDSVARTITIVDDGGGMALDTINKAFLTMAGTEKDTARASGGLGIAKMLFLLGNKALRLETVRAGKIHRMDTTGEQIAEALDDSTRAPQIETRSTTAAPGTTVVVTLPETYVDTDTEEVKKIHFPPNYALRDLIDASPLFANIEVVLNGGARPVGARYELNGATLLTAVNFAWGTARLLVRPNIDANGGSNFNVLSEGLNQFSLGISKEPGNPYGDPVPYDFILNLEPDVKADSPRYPIALNRKDFSPSGKSDMAALISYVNVLYANKSEQDSAKSFGQLTLISQSPQGSVLKRIDLNIPDAAVGSVLSIDPSDVVTVTDGRVYVNNKLTPPLTKENIKAMRRDPAQFRVDQSQIDPRDIIVHDNVLTNGQPLLEEARIALGANAVNGFLQDFGRVFQELRAAVGRVGGASYASVTQVPTGLSFDLEYYGVNTVIPFKAIMLNPLVVRDKETGGPMRPDTVSLADRAGTFVGTMVHELTHHAERNHSETGFIPELARLSVQLAVSGDMATAVENVNQLLQRYDAVAEYFMERYANGNLTARGIRLDGDAQTTRFQRLPERAVGLGGAGQDGADSVREGVGRGDTTGTRSQERGGPAAEGGDGVAVAALPPGDLQREANLARHMEGSVAPFVLYHGTGVHEAGRGKNARPLGDIDTFDRYAANKAFNRPEGMDAVGTWLDESPSKTGAGMYAGSTGAIYPVHASLKNPWKFKSFDEFLNLMHTAAGRDPKAQTPKGSGTVGPLRDYLMSRGYDSIVFPPGTVDDKDQGRVWVALNPESQLKSATGNNGQFSPDTGDIRFSVKSDKMGATGTAKAWVEFAEVKKLIDFGVVKTLAQAKAAAEADYTKTFDALPAFDAKAYLEGVIAVEGPLLPQNIQNAVQAYKNGDEGGAVGTLLADVKRAREGNIARWKDYFDNVNTEQGSDPFWKSYVAHGVVNTFDATKPNTGETFNAAALATVYGKFLEGTAPNFTKAYRAAKMAATTNLVELGDAQNGWRKVPRTAKSDPNFAERVAEVQAISSESWCTKTYNAAPYIEKGDFWVYVDNGKPELAIRFEGSDVAEIQGRANNGSIPSQYAGEVQALVDSGKIQNLSPRTKKALQDATDRSLALKRLESEATFVEEIDSGGASILVYEKANGDIVLLTEAPWAYLPAQYTNRVVEVIGNLYLPEGAQANNLTTVSGDLQVDVGAQVNNLTTVGGRVVLHRGVQANSLTTVGGGLDLREGAQANSVTTVGGNLFLREGAQANSVTTVGGNLDLYDGAQVNSLTTVGGNLNLYEGAQANSLTTVGGNLTLREGAQANSLTTVGGNLNLYGGAQANSVTTVGGYLELNEGAQVNSVTTVGGRVFLHEGVQANSLTTVGGGLTLYTGAQANSVTTVGGSLELYERAQANSVTTVGGSLELSKGAQANSLTTVGGDLKLYRGAQANSVTTVGGNLDLYEGAQANSVTTVGGDLFLYDGAQALSLQAVGRKVYGTTPENTPNLKHIGDKDAVERIRVQTEKFLIGTAPSGSITTLEVEAAVISALDNLNIGTEIYGTVEEARAETGVDIPVGAKGMYAQGKIHLFAENIENAVDAQITVWHEILHAGLDRLYKSGSKKFNAALVTIAARNPRVREEAEKWTKSFGADVEAEAIRLGATPERAAQYTRMRAIDEALAIMSSENVTIRGLDKFIAVVQKTLRGIGLTKLADAMEGKTNAEALALISKARGALLADGSYVVTDSAPAFLRGASLQNRPLRLTGTGPNGRILNWDLGRAFTRAHKAQYGRVFNVDRPADRAEMVKSLNAEYRNQTRQPDNGEEWYVEDIAKAIKTTRAILPELRVPTNRDLFLTIAALTSPQQKPNQNWQNAIHAMRGYTKTGRIALVKPNGKAFGVPSQTTGLQLLQHLIDTKGLADALEWLNASHSGREIAEVRRDSGIYEAKASLAGYTANETMLAGEYLGITMFGPKVSEFMLNATGIDPNAVTVDLWLARTYNRLLGRLTDVSPQNKKDQKIQSEIRSRTEREDIKSLVRDVAAQNGISPSAMQAALWYFEQRLYRHHGLNAPSQNFSGAAALAVGNERSRSSGDVQRASEDEVPAVSGRGKTKKVVESIPYNAVQTTVRLNKLEDETDPVALKDGVAALARDLREQAASKPVRERSRGYAWIQERLLRAARRGEMNREQVRLGMWLLNNNPNLANDLGISLKGTESNAAGNYNPMSRIMTLFKERGEDTLIAHEILHHAERMMPREVQDGIRAEWLSQITGMLDAAIRTNDTEMVDHLRDVLRAAAGNTTAYNRVADAIRNGTLSQDFYQYINPSEFWAVNAADIVAARASESWVQRAVQWLREFKAKIQELFGFPSNAAVIRGLDNVLNAANEGARQSPNMLDGGNIFNAMGNRTEPTLPVPSTFTEKKKDLLTYKVVDRFLDLKNLMKTIKSLAPALPESLDAYGLVERLTARVAKQVKDFGNREIDPLIKDMQARGVSVPELDNYLWMRAAPEANAIIEANRILDAQSGKKVPTFPGAGVSTAAAQAYLAALTPQQRTAFEALAKRVDAITAKTRREWVRYGMATLDDVLKLEREQQYYVPFNREGKDIGAGTGQGVSVRGPNTFHRRGSERPVVDVLANIIHQRDRAIVRGEKNLVSRAIYTLAKTFPDAEMWSLAKPALTSAIDAETGEPVSILDMSYQKDDNVLMSIRLDKNGKMVAQGVEFNKDNDQALRMVGALKNLDLPSLEGVYAGVAPITRYFAALNTQYNPIFGLINLARDVSSGMLNLSTTAIAGKQFQVAKLILPVLASIYGITRAERQGSPPGTGKYAVYFERFQNAGGSTGWRDSFATSGERGKALQKELDSLSYGTAQKILPAIGGWLSDYNTAMEGSTRLAAFIVAVESGLSDAQAASIAKNLTVNFDRKGAISGQIGALYAFFNPAVQGTVRTLETLRGPTGRKIIAGGLLLGAIQAVALAMAGFDDEDPPEFVRQRNVIIPIGDKKYVSYPMPLGFNILPNIGRLAMQTAIRPANIGKNVLSAMETVLSTFNPFGAGLTYQTFAPTVLDPFVAVGTNTDWTGKPIERKDFSSLDPTPGYTRAKDNASWVSTILAQGINTLTFGDKYTPGMLSPTPDLIDYIGGQLTGGPGRELLNLETALEGWFSGKEVPTYKIPVAGRFYGNTGTEASDKARFYENVQTLNVLENNVRERQRDRVSSAAFRRDNPETRLIPMANIIKRQITQYRAQKENPGNDDVKTDALILRQMQRLNELAARYKIPTAQQKFLRVSKP